MLTKIMLELDPLQLAAVQNALNVAQLHIQGTLFDIQRQAQAQIEADAKAMAEQPPKTDEPSETQPKE